MSGGKTRGNVLMKKALLALSLLLPSAGTAMAQSLPDEVKPIGNLESPYNLIIPNYEETPRLSAWEGFQWKPLISYNSMSFGSSRLRDADGITLGAAVGYDFRYNDFIIGPTADLSYDFLYGDSSRIDGVPGYKAHADFDGSVGGRAGFLIMDRTLVYATGGYAFSNLTVKNRDLGVSDSNTLSGWTAGGGIEYLWNSSNSLRFEYKRVQFSNEDFDSLPDGRDSVKASMDKFSFGFVHRF
jgi:outer membrane immunogenic protein